MSTRRNVILEDKDYPKNEEARMCFPCYYGIEHEKVEDFIEDVLTNPKGLVKRSERGFSSKSDSIEYFEQNYSKLELCILLDMHMRGEMGVEQQITLNKEDSATYAFAEIIKTMFKK